MKKLLALAGIALIAAACTNNDEPVQECGQINLTLENSTAPEIEVSTRTVTDLTETDAKDYNIQVLQNGNVKLESTNFLTFKNTTFIFPIGSGYTVTAESCTEEVGQSANDGVGQIRYFGTSAPFEVKTNEISNVKVTCTMANAKVSIAYDEVFAQVFNGYTVEVSTEAEPSRIITFDSNGKCNSTYDAAFFNIDSKNPNLKCTVSGTYKGNVRTATQTIQLEAAKWYKLNIKTSASGRKASRCRSKSLLIKRGIYPFYVFSNTIICLKYQSDDVKDILQLFHPDSIMCS